MRFVFTVPVWGERYVSRFLELSLPTLLAKGNLDGFPDLAESRFLIITTPTAAPTLRASPSIRALAHRVDLEILDLPDLESGNKYATASACQTVALQQTEGMDGICFLYADMIWAEGSLCAAEARLTQGYDAVFCPGPPVLADRFPRALLDKAQVSVHGEGETHIGIDSRALSRVSLGSLHPGMVAYQWDRPGFTLTPAYVTFETPDGGLLVHAFHLHPVLMRIHHDNPHFLSPIQISLDEEFVTRANPSADRSYCVPDSDEVAMVSLMDADAMQTGRFLEGKRPDAAFLARWAEEFASPLHREFFRRPYRMHTGELYPDAWAPIEARARHLVDEMDRRLRIPDSVLSYEDPDAYGARRRRGKRMRKLRRPPARLPYVHRRIMWHEGYWRLLGANLKQRFASRHPGLSPLLMRMGRMPGGRRLRSVLHDTARHLGSTPSVPSRLILKEVWYAWRDRRRGGSRSRDRVVMPEDPDGA